MKKLLSLLSVLTISGTAIPTVIAVSPYQKQEKLNSNINSQENSLEKLKRSKRNNINNNVYHLDKDWTQEVVRMDIYYNIPQIKNVKSITSSPNTGIVYYNTTEGVYYIPAGSSWNPIKITGINEPVSQIIVTPTKHAYFLTENGYVYHLDKDWTQEVVRMDTYYNIPQIKNVKSITSSPNTGIVYYKTTEGVYYIPAGSSWNPIKITGINEPVSQIIVTPTKHAYFLTENGYVYHLDKDWTQEVVRMDIYYNIPQIKNVKSITSSPNTGIVYYNTTEGVYYIPAGSSWNPIKITGINEPVSQIIVTPTKHAYFLTENGYVYYLDKNSTQEVVRIDIYYNIPQIKNVKSITSSPNTGIVYYNTTEGVYYIPAGSSWNPIKITGINEPVNQIIVTPTKHAYFLESINISNIIKNKSINDINMNTDNVILNELNYLNYNLDISQLYVINKTNTSATIKAKSDSNKYFGENEIYYTINNQQNKIINLNELIKKGIFLNFRDKNQIIIKEITNINKNDLIYSNVTATKSIEPIYTKNSKSICLTTLFHNLPEKQNMKTPSCKYTKETTINTQITTGLSKTDSEEKTTEQTSTSNMEHNWSFELGINLNKEFGIWPFKVSTDINTKIGTRGSYGFSTTNTSSETKNLNNTFDFSNSKTNEYKESWEVELPSQEIEVKPNQKIKVTASLDEVLAQVTLNLKQDIYGTINAKVMTLNNEEKTITLSIKEIMQKLKQYDILPQEITINNDDSITFNGKASRSLKQGFDGNIEFHEVN